MTSVFEYCGEQDPHCYFADFEVRYNHRIALGNFALTVRAWRCIISSANA